MNGNEVKASLLGMPYGTANGKLKKSLLFELANRCNLLNCFRCSKPIEFIEEFSIEHKKSWMSSSLPKETFFDVTNIAFSHLACNSADGGRRFKIHESAKDLNRSRYIKLKNNKMRYEKHLEAKRRTYKTGE